MHLRYSRRIRLSIWKVMKVISIGLSYFEHNLVAQQTSHFPAVRAGMKASGTDYRYLHIQWFTDQSSASIEDWEAGNYKLEIHFSTIQFKLDLEEKRSYMSSSPPSSSRFLQLQTSSNLINYINLLNLFSNDFLSDVQQRTPPAAK